MKKKIRIPKKGWHYANVLLVAATAWVISGFLGDIAARSMGNGISATRNQEAILPLTSHNQKERDYSAILRGNIFNSAQSEEDRENLAPLNYGSGQLSGAPKSSVAAILRGTVVDSDSRYSRATLTLKSSKKEIVLKEQDTLLGTTLIKISRNTIYLSRDGRTEVLSVPFNLLASFSSGGGRRKGGGRLAGNADVSKASEGEYLVSRRYIDAQLANMNKLITEVRAVPNIGKDGVTDGFRLFSIKKGSLFDKIGFTNRDVVKRINGISLDSAEKGLELFSALRSESNFEVDIERNKERQSLRFSIQ